MSASRPPRPPRPLRPLRPLRWSALALVLALCAWLCLATRGDAWVGSPLAAALSEGRRGALSPITRALHHPHMHLNNWLELTSYRLRLARSAQKGPNFGDGEYFDEEADEEEDTADPLADDGEEDEIVEEEDVEELRVDVEDREEEDAAPQSPLSRIGSGRVKVAPRRRLSADPAFGGNPLASDSPTYDYVPPLPRFSRNFVAWGLSTLDQRELRRQYWLSHLQWLRRSALLASVPYVPVETDEDRLRSAEVEVREAYTLLSADRLAPLGQCVLLSANSSAAVQDYLRLEPLQCAGVLHWAMLEMEPSRAILADAYSPFLLLACSPNTDALADAARFHVQYPVDKEDGHLELALSYRNMTRTSMFATLHAAQDPAHPSPALGEVCVFNADTNKEALAYLSYDRALGLEAAPSAMDTWDSRVLVCRNDSERGLVLVSPVNVLDVNGLHRLAPRTFADKSQLDKIHFEDPEALLLPLEPQSLREGGVLEEHFLETARVRRHFHQRDINFRAARKPELELPRDSQRRAMAQGWEQSQRSAPQITSVDVPVEELEDSSVDSALLLPPPPEEDAADQ